MSTIRNILVSFGAFWVSLWVALLVGSVPDALINSLVRDENTLSAVAMGVLSSAGRSLGAALAGILVTLVIAGRKSQFWAFIVAVLYVVDAPVRHHWGPPATGWDHLWQSVDLVFPAIACIVAAFIAARIRRSRSNPGSVTRASAAG